MDVDGGSDQNLGPRGLLDMPARAFIRGICAYVVCILCT